MKKPLCLIIRDGWGLGEKIEANAIYSAKTPFTDLIEQKYPYSVIETSGSDVGLPDGYQGNSEVGHLNIGAGRVVYQSLSRIDRSIQDGSFFENEQLNKSLDLAKERNSTVHLMGLIQEEGIHSVTRHCLAILQLCKDKGLSDVLIHGISDGRDTPPKSALDHFNFLQNGINDAGIGRIASVTGRYYAMDRDNRWERTESFYRCLMEGIAQEGSCAAKIIEESYKKGITDEFIKPHKINYDGIKEQDVIIFFNFRFDRTRQLTKAVVENDFKEFKTITHDLCFTTMTHYYDNGNFSEIFPQLNHNNLLGEIVSDNKLKQLRCSETEKYAHVTFFFNGLKNAPFPLEDRIMVNSPKVATYDLKPEMSAFEVKDEVLKALDKNLYDFIVINFANCDMVGHTGIYPKIIRAVETVDECCAAVVNEILDKDGVAIVTADHGNAEQTKLEDNSPMTSHTKRPVPLSIVSNQDLAIRNKGKLCDIAPTILELLNLPKPKDMTGLSLLKK